MRTAKKEPGTANKKLEKPKSSKVLSLAPAEVQEVQAGKPEATPPPEWAVTPGSKSHGMVPKRVSIRMEQGSFVKGKINLRSELAIRDGSYDCYSLDSGAFYATVSDLFSKGLNPFIEVFEVEGCDDGPILIINKSKIIWIAPDEQ